MGTREEEEEEESGEPTSEEYEEHAPTSNLGQITHIEKASFGEEYPLLTLESSVDKWTEGLTMYHEFIRSTKSLESQYKRLTPMRNRYSILSGSLLWLTIAVIVLGTPLAVPLGWDNVSKLCGWSLVTLSAEFGIFSLVPLSISCYIAGRKRLANPVYFFPFHLEIQILALFLVVTGALLLVHGYNFNTNGPAFAAFIITLTLCGLISTRIVVLNTPDPATYLFLTGLFATSILGYYTTLEGVFYGTHWWTSFLGPSIILALFFVVASLHLFRLAYRRRRKPSGNVLPWGYSFRHRFISGIQDGPFFLTPTISHQPKKRRTVQSPVKRVESVTTASASDDSTEKSPLNNENSTDRIQRYKSHLGFLDFLLEGTLLAAIGFLMISVGILFAGLFVSRHYAQIPQHRNMASTFHQSRMVETIPVDIFIKEGDLQNETESIEKINPGEKQGRKNRSLIQRSKISEDTDESNLEMIAANEGQKKLNITSNEQKPMFKDYFTEFIKAESLVGFSASWWISVTTLSLGLILSTRLMVYLFGSWLEFLAFSFLDVSNRNTLIDLNYPDHDIKTDPRLLSEEVRKKAKTVLKTLDEFAYDIFTKPTFEGCTVKLNEEV